MGGDPLTDIPFLNQYGADGGGVRLFSLGRHALAAGLRMLGIGSGDRVLVPAFICRDLLAPIHGVGAQPLLYPVAESLAPLELPVADRVRAVVAVNYFGFPQRFDLFRAYRDTSGAALIEDNAHGLLSRDEDGLLLGTRGDLGILSLRKTIAAPDGAVLIAPGGDLRGRLPSELRCRDVRLDIGYMAKRALRRVQNATHIPVRTAAERLRRTVRRVRTGHALPLPLADAETHTPGPAAIHCESIAMFRTLNASAEVERRRAAYAQLHHELRSLGLAPVFGTLPAFTAPYGYPFRARPDVAAHVAKLVERRGFDCCPWPDLPTAIEHDAPEFYRNVYHVNFLC